MIFFYQAFTSFPFRLASGNKILQFSPALKISFRRRNLHYLFPLLTIKLVQLYSTVSANHPSVSKTALTDVYYSRAAQLLKIFEVCFSWVWRWFSPVATAGFGMGLAPQMQTWSTINQWSLRKFWECQAPCTSEKPPYWRPSGDGSALVPVERVLHFV